MSINPPAVDVSQDESFRSEDKGNTGSKELEGEVRSVLGIPEGNIAEKLRKEGEAELLGRLRELTGAQLACSKARDEVENGLLQGFLATSHHAKPPHLIREYTPASKEDAEILANQESIETL